MSGKVSKICLPPTVHTNWAETWSHQSFRILTSISLCRRRNLSGWYKSYLNKGTRVAISLTLLRIRLWWDRLDLHHLWWRITRPLWGLRRSILAYTLTNGSRHRPGPHRIIKRPSNSSERRRIIPRWASTRLMITCVPPPVYIIWALKRPMMVLWELSMPWTTRGNSKKWWRDRQVKLKTHSSAAVRKTSCLSIQPVCTIGSLQSMVTYRSQLKANDRLFSNNHLTWRAATGAIRVLDSPFYLKKYQRLQLRLSRD